MALEIQGITDLYNFLSDSRDPRTKHWLFIQPTHFLLIEAFYLIFTLRVGPWFMRNRPSYNLRHIISAYNVLQVVFNLYVCYEAYLVLSNRGFNFRCQPVDFSNSKTALTIIIMCWWTYCSKIMDLLDTVFFVLKKKDSQLSFLHVYHHSFMIFCGFLIMSYQPGGNAIFGGVLNCFVHAIMYSYYFITNLGPEYKRFAWWKKYLTQLQIIQLVIIAVHAFQGLFRDCNYPKFLTVLIFTQTTYLAYLFGVFYARSYLGTKLNNKKK